MPSPIRPRKLTLGELRMEQVERLARPGTLIVCAVALVVSYWQIKWTAGVIGLPPVATWLFPLLVDLPAAIASGLSVALHNRPFKQRAYAWTVLLVFLVVSWWCNGLHAVRFLRLDMLPPGMRGYSTAVVWTLALIPPLGASLGPHMYAFALRNGVRADDTTSVHTNAPTRATPAPATRAPARAVSAQQPPAPRAQPAPPARAPLPAAAAGMRAARTADAPFMATARTMYEAALAAQPGVKPDAAAVWRAIAADGYTGNVATPRRWIKEWYEAEHPAATPAAATPAAEAIVAEQDAAAPARDPLNLDDLVVAARQDDVESGSGPAAA